MLKCDQPIKTRLKPCKRCGDPARVWSRGMCKNCAHLTKISERAKSVPLKQTTNGKEAKPFKVGKPIKKVSDKRQKELAEYEKRKAEYFKRVPVCEFPGCESREISLHHKKGRIGKLLTDIRYFCSLCWEHHQYCETHPKEAKELKLSIDRLTAA